jgi:MFS family permease
MDGAPAGFTSPRISRQRGQILFFGLIMFLDFGAVSALAGAYGPFTRISLGINLLRTTLFLLPAGAAAAVSLYVMSRYSRPRRRLREMSALYLLAGAGALGLAVSPTPSAALFVAIALGAGLGGIGPIVAATVVDLSGTSNRGAVVGSLLALEGLGSVAGPATVGLVTDLLNPRAGMATIGAIFVALVVVTASGVRGEWRNEPLLPQRTA